MPGKVRGRGGTAATRGQQPQPEEQSDSEEEVAEAGAGSAEMGEPMEPTITDLASILRAHMDQQQARDARIAVETVQQEQQFRALCQQCNMLQSEVQSHTSATLEQLSGKADILGANVMGLEEINRPQQTLFGVARRDSFSAVPLRTQEPRLQQLTDSDDI